MEPVHPIERIKGSYPATYRVNRRESLCKLPRVAVRAFFCSCGAIYAWRLPKDEKEKEWRPLCPKCVQLAPGELMIRAGSRWRLSDVPEGWINAPGIEDGVYVDVSLRDKHMTLGFAVVQNERARFLSCSASNHVSTACAEHEAVLLAQRHWPGLNVYCDFMRVCNLTGATYIDRRRNHLAHRVARQRINFKGWLVV